MNREQHVCLVCGFNMIGFHPTNCPFCGAAQKHFITAEECSARYRVAAIAVNDKVGRLNSQPALGIEHAAYRIETGHGSCWIDCPSSFDASLPRTDTILFTHHHFLGASNLYRELFAAEVRIHQEDSLHEICRPFTFDVTFTENFVHNGIEAYHVGGHTPGFTFYIFEDVLFICDYVFLDGDAMKYNPFGPAGLTVAGGRVIRDVVEDHQLSTVCGYNYVIGYDDWKRRFDAGPLFGGY
ncbi:MAG: MBL fold metallo-hydrolase [Geobacteraceae bacterium GWC2_58_44]|nr:MAG: MBL fold metallo-hydrolase [Geobacteraceae bacterium GWC2_58_44]